MTQHSVKKGLKKFGDAGVNAVLKELQQLHDRKVLEPTKGPGEITSQERKDSLRYLMFLKEKRCGTIKGRGCADGRKQREHISKDETSSPTVAIKSVMLSCTIDAREHRDVATADIPGAFMQTALRPSATLDADVMLNPLFCIAVPRRDRNASSSSTSSRVFVLFSKSITISFIIDTPQIMRWTLIASIRRYCVSRPVSVEVRCGTT